MDLFVTAAAGTEGALRDELREIGLRVRADRGGVHVAGDARVAWRICLESRIAVRVMIAVGEIERADETSLYEGVRAMEWERWLDPSRTLAVSAVARSSKLTHTGYIAQRTKDAIVDRQRAQGGARSDVARHDPDLAVFVHLKNDHAQVFLDAAGRSLHERGWRARGGSAPLKETLAAAIVRLSGWDRERPFVDPMCGSGTIAIEADLWARRVPPQSRTRRFGFERWADFDDASARELEALRAEVFAAARDRGPDCFASDLDARAIELTRANASRAGAQLQTRMTGISEIGPLRSAGQLVTNPPYGVRLGDSDALWDELREMLARFSGHGAALLVPDEPSLHLGPRRPDARHRLYNGDLACALVLWRAL